VDAAISVAAEYAFEAWRVGEVVPIGELGAAYSES
jgi:hypothetical protein